MSKTTRATQMLTKASIAFTTVTYDYDPNADRIGLQAAEAIGEAPHLVLKTLMAELDGKPVCVIVPSDREVSMKKLAAAFGGTRTPMLVSPTGGACRRRSVASSDATSAGGPCASSERCARCESVAASGRGGSSASASASHAVGPQRTGKYGVSA